MKDVDESFQSRNMDLRTDLLLFFANKIDVPKENDESESTVIDDVLNRVKETWGLVRRAQVIPLEAKQVSVHAHVWKSDHPFPLEIMF